MTAQNSTPHLPLLFIQAKEILAAPFRPLLKHFGLTEQQWRTLRVLHDEGSLEPRQLCDLCQFHSSSMAGMLARMEEMGLVHKERMETDQRRVMVHLTDKSRQIVRDALPLVHQQYEILAETLGKERLLQTQDFLKSLIALKDTDIPQVLPPDAKDEGRPS